MNHNNNKELKQQAHKEFDEKFPMLEEVTDWDMEESINKKRAVKSFIDSLIDKTVQITEERIVGVINQIETDGTDSQGYIKGYIIDKIKSLITNKGDNNKTP